MILVKGDHPVARRPDRTFQSPKEAFDYAQELTDLGYENVTVYVFPQEGEE